ncbi:hypothetical protein M3J09_011665 [Ascochyta lentis]
MHTRMQLHNDRKVLQKPHSSNLAETGDAYSRQASDRSSNMGLTFQLTDCDSFCGYKKVVYHNIAAHRWNAASSLAVGRTNRDIARLKSCHSVGPLGLPTHHTRNAVQCSCRRETDVRQ